ncbi:MAG: DoxX family protein [Chloroflexota bacterium]
MFSGFTPMDWLMFAAAIVLGVAFLVAGLAKLAVHRSTLMHQPLTAWTADFAPLTVKVIGLIEVLAAIGIVAGFFFVANPSNPILLIPLCSAILAIDQVVAILVHLRRQEPGQLLLNVVLLALALFVLITPWVY